MHAVQWLAYEILCFLLTVDRGTCCVYSSLSLYPGGHFSLAGRPTLTPLAQAVKDFSAHVKKDARSLVTMVPVRDGMTVIHKAC